MNLKPVFRKIKPPRYVFLDSGAFGLFARKAKNSKGQRDYSYYESKEFKRYVRKYAKFIIQHQDGMDFYANVDVLYQPELTYKVQKYLENKYGLNPIPVVHSGTDLKWVKKYVDEGYEFIGLGGRGTGRGRGDYMRWADKVFNYLCPASNDFLPLVKVHGFAMTSYDLMIRYPWWSMDSTSWVQTAAWGGIYVPHKRNGKFTFTEAPYQVVTSPDSPSAKNGRKEHYLSKSPNLKKLVLEWLEQVNVPLGSQDPYSWGVVSEHNARKIANLRFFDIMVKSLPQWPWPFKPKSVRKGLLEV